MESKLNQKMKELKQLEKAIDGELTHCAEQLAAWAERKQKAANARLVLDGRIAAVTELLMTTEGSDVDGGDYTADAEAAELAAAAEAPPGVPAP